MPLTRDCGGLRCTHPWHNPCKLWKARPLGTGRPDKPSSAVAQSTQLLSTPDGHMKPKRVAPFVVLSAVPLASDVELYVVLEPDDDPCLRELAYIGPPSKGGAR